jgi:hypothetical protein
VRPFLVTAAILGIGAVAALYVWIGEDDQGSTTPELVAAITFYGCVLGLAILVVVGVVAGIKNLLGKRD